MASRPQALDAPYLFDIAPPHPSSPTRPRNGTNGKHAASAPDPDFERWWAAYPKKRAKLDAAKAWRQTRALRPPVEQMLAMLELQVASADWQCHGGAYVPHPATYLRGGRWEDVLTPARASRPDLPVGLDEARLASYGDR